MTGSAREIVGFPKKIVGIVVGKSRMVEGIETCAVWGSLPFAFQAHARLVALNMAIASCAKALALGEGGAMLFPWMAHV